MWLKINRMHFANKLIKTRMNSSIVQTAVDNNE